MSAHRLPNDLNLAPFAILDPGDAGTIRADRDFCYVPIVTAAAETRTLLAPLGPGRIVILAMDTYAVGACTITVTGGVNDTSNTALVLSATGQYAILISVQTTSSTYAWNVLTTNCGASSVVRGYGTTTSPLTDATADKNFFEYRLKCTAATGTTRGLYQRMWLTGGAGGETIRSYTTVGAAAPVDTCNGAHISLDFGTSAGNITGLGTAVRATLHCNARSITGTTAAVMAELYGEASGLVGGTMSCIRLCVDGSDSTAKADLLDKAYAFEIVAAASEGHMVEAGATLGTAYGGIKCLVNGAVMYIPLYAAAPS